MMRLFVAVVVACPWARSFGYFGGDGGPRGPRGAIIEEYREALEWLEELRWRKAGDTAANQGNILLYPTLLDGETGAIAERGLRQGLEGWLAQADVEAHRETLRRDDDGRRGPFASSSSSSEESEGHHRRRPDFCDEEKDRESSSNNKKRLVVRRELRALASSERRRLFAAFREMAATPGAEGRERYGPRFVTFGELGALHLSTVRPAVLIPNAPFRCDEAHFYPGFAAWHRAYLLAVQEAVWAVDPLAPPVPYYDLASDVATYGLSRLGESPIFSAAFLGDKVGDPDRGYAVPGFWGFDDEPVEIPNSKTTPTAAAMSPYANGGGFLRNKNNPTTTPFITRFPPFYFEIDLSKNDALASATPAFEALAVLAEDAGDLESRIALNFNGPHILLHQSTGVFVADGKGKPPWMAGYDHDQVWGNLKTFTDYDNDGRARPTWYASAPDLIKMIFYTVTAGYEAIDVDTGCISEARCFGGNKEKKKKKKKKFPKKFDASCGSVIDFDKCVANGTASGNPFTQDVWALRWPVYATGRGDLVDLAGPVEPMFPPQHANVDRLYLEWQSYQVHRGRYPMDSTAGYANLTDAAPPFCPTHHTDADVVTRPDDAYDLQWSTIFHGLFANVDPNASPTIRDAMTVANLPYTYDSICGYGPLVEATCGGVAKTTVDLFHAGRDACRLSVVVDDYYEEGDDFYDLLSFFYLATSACGGRVVTLGTFRADALTAPPFLRGNDTGFTGDDVIEDFLFRFPDESLAAHFHAVLDSLYPYFNASRCANFPH